MEGIFFNVMQDPCLQVESVRISDKPINGRVIPIQRMTMEEISALNETLSVQECRPVFQCFDSGTRMKGLDLHCANPDESAENQAKMSQWNGVISLDIDFKQLTGTYALPDMRQLYRDMLARLMHDQNYLYSYLTKSGLGIRFGFFANVEKTYTAYQKCFSIFTARCKRVLEHIDNELYHAAEEWDKQNPKKAVWDTHAGQPVQLMAMSQYPVHISTGMSNPRFGVLPLDGCGSKSLPVIAEARQKRSVSSPVSTFEYDLSDIRYIPSPEHEKAIKTMGGHDGCFPIYQALYLYFGDAGKEQAWQVVLMLDSQGLLPRRSTHGHNLRQEFDTNYRHVDEDQIASFALDLVANHLNIRHSDINRSALQWIENHSSGEKWQVQPWESNTDTIHLSEDEYVSDYTEHIKRQMVERGTQQVYISAGCGTGKTNLIREWFKNEENAIIVAHLNSTKEQNFQSKFDSEGFQYYEPKNISDLRNEIRKGFRHSHALLGWPQLSELLKSNIDLSKYIFLIDEYHSYTDKTYRMNDIKSMIFNRGKIKKLVAVSATPLYEGSLLMDENALRITFNKQVDYTLRVHRYTNTGWQGKIVDSIVSECLRLAGERHKCLIFDNQNHNRYLKKLESSPFRIAHCCKMKKHSDREFRQILETRTTQADILICTSFVEEGIEIMNNIDNLYVFVPRYASITTNDLT